VFGRDAPHFIEGVQQFTLVGDCLLGQANCSALKATVMVLPPTRRDHW
jgi:hypothetical protein